MNYSCRAPLDGSTRNRRICIFSCFPGTYASTGPVILSVATPHDSEHAADTDLHASTLCIMVSGGMPHYAVSAHICIESDLKHELVATMESTHVTCIHTTRNGPVIEDIHCSEMMPRGVALSRLPGQLANPVCCRS